MSPERATEKTPKHSAAPLGLGGDLENECGLFYPRLTPRAIDYRPFLLRSSSYGGQVGTFFLGIFLTGQWYIFKPTLT